MRLLTRLLALGSSLVLAAGCGAVAPDAAATVNGVDVPRPLFESVVASSQDQAVAAAEEAATAAGEELTTEQRQAAIQEHQRGMLTLLIQDAVITSMIADAGIAVDEVDTTSLRADIVEAVEGEERLEELLARDGWSLEVFDEVLLPQQARVEALREELEVETRTVRHILVETQEEADEVVAELDADADFAELAQERSMDAGSGAQGGELPPAPRGSYVEEFEEAVWDAEIGELVGPVESQFGFHVLEVVGEDVIPGDELAPQQADQQLGAMLEAAYAEVVVEVDPAFGEWDPQTRSVVPTDGVGESAELPAEPDVGDSDVDELDLGDPEELEGS